jgi:hypothetical protein
MVGRTLSAEFAGMGSQMADKQNDRGQALTGRLRIEPTRAAGRCLILIWACGLCFSLGCQCSPWTNSYAQLIDKINDHPPQCDRWYSSRFDLTRIGKADWCHGANRQLCRCRCEENGSFETGCDDHIYPTSYPFVFPTDRLGTGWRSASVTELPTAVPVASAPAN